MLWSKKNNGENYSLVRQENQEILLPTDLAKNCLLIIINKPLGLIKKS
jgi:hypothetical protein